MLVITVDMLESHEACSEGIEFFTRLFGESLEIDSKEKAVKLAVKFCHALDVFFLEGLIEDKKAYHEAKAPLWKAYHEAKAPLWRAYEEGEAPLWKAYSEAKAPLWKDYEEAVAPLLKAYREAVAPLEKAYEEAEAKLIAEMLWDQSQQET